MDVGSGSGVDTEAPASVLVDAGDGNSYLVTGLNEYTLYEFEVFASTRVGPGPSTQEVARTHESCKPIRISCTIALIIVLIFGIFRSTRPTTELTEHNYRKQDGID